MGTAKKLIDYTKPSPADVNKWCGKSTVLEQHQT